MEIDSNASTAARSSISVSRPAWAAPDESKSSPIWPPRGKTYLNPAGGLSALRTMMLRGRLPLMARAHDQHSDFGIAMQSALTARWQAGRS